MRDWTIPGFYVLAYVGKATDGIYPVHCIDLSHPYVVCPLPSGRRWRYLRQRIMTTGDLRTGRHAPAASDRQRTDIGILSTKVVKPAAGYGPDVRALVEAMCVYSFAPPQPNETDGRWKTAGRQIARAGYSPDEFYADVICVDFGAAGKHRYCLFGGPNRLVYNILQRDAFDCNIPGSIRPAMTREWHARMASYLGVILWSKIRVSPLLRAILIGDEFAPQCSREGTSLEMGFQKLVTNALMAYARNPL